MDNNNLPQSLVETLHQLGKDFLEISDNILLYLYLEVSIIILPGNCCTVCCMADVKLF